MNARWTILGLPLILAACSGEEVWAPDDFVERSIYRHDGPPTITLYTMKNVGTGNGAHSGLMINGSQRVIFDPAGSFGHETLPERNDVVFGITEQVEEYYTSYHARETYYVVRQEIEVAPEVAEHALQLVMNYGAVPPSYCTRSISTVLSQLDGFDAISATWFPGNLSEDFAQVGDISTSVHREEDDEDKEIARAAFVNEAAAIALANSQSQ